MIFSHICVMPFDYILPSLFFLFFKWYLSCFHVFCVYTYISVTRENRIFIFVSIVCFT